MSSDETYYSATNETSKENGTICNNKNNNNNNRINIIVAPNRNNNNSRSKKRRKTVAKKPPLKKHLSYIDLVKEYSVKINRHGVVMDVKENNNHDTIGKKAFIEITRSPLILTNDLDIIHLFFNSLKSTNGKTASNRLELWNKQTLLNRSILSSTIHRSNKEITFRVEMLTKSRNINVIDIFDEFYETYSGIISAGGQSSAVRIPVLINLLNYRQAFTDLLPFSTVNENEKIQSIIHLLPSNAFDGLWENLQFESNIKSDLLQYMYSALVFANKGVNKNIVTWNRALLLHGPPGTGKTSLCKALAQKLSIYLHQYYQKTFLIEIHSQRLFSEWYSQSSKLVVELFQSIYKLASENPSYLFLVLIDEIESISSKRGSMQSEPMDSMRVVNSLLTQLDQLKQLNNIMVITTSNLKDSIDDAFIDRVDLIQNIGRPSISAIYSMLISGIIELQRCGIIVDDPEMLPYDEICRILHNWMMKPAPSYVKGRELAIRRSLNLLNIAQQYPSVSGRTWRKLPLIAHFRRNNNSACLTTQDYIRSLYQNITIIDKEQKSIKKKDANQFIYYQDAKEFLADHDHGDVTLMDSAISLIK
ncbi:hypothetical protein SNEBB_008194 [Seison nebaliae]|nr:hypothetical protein SNEBB_008194 [Seison nebaliae]